MNIKKILALLLLLTMLVGCSGSVGEISEYNGWWSYYTEMVGGTTDEPFAYIYIDGANNYVELYNAQGFSVGSGPIEQSGDDEAFEDGAAHVFNTSDGNDYAIYSAGEDDMGVYINVSKKYSHTYMYRPTSDPSVITNGYVDPMEDFMGYWKASEGLPFDTLWVDYNYVVAYDADLNEIDYGYVDFNEQRMLNGLAAVVMSFDTIGDYGCSIHIVNETETLEMMDYTTWPGGDSISLELIGSDMPSVDTEDQDDATDETDGDTDGEVIEALGPYLHDVIGHSLGDRTISQMGEVEINGEMLSIFSVGVETEVSFTADMHYAVSHSGEIYYNDDINSDDWQLYEGVE